MVLNFLAEFSLFAIIFAAYLSAGLVFGLLFVFWFVNFLDVHAKGGTIGFRLIILPAAVVLWGALFFVMIFRGISRLSGRTRRPGVRAAAKRK